MSKRDFVAAARAALGRSREPVEAPEPAPATLPSPADYGEPVAWLRDDPDWPAMQARMRGERGQAVKVVSVGKTLRSESDESG